MYKSKPESNIRKGARGTLSGTSLENGRIARTLKNLINPDKGAEQNV